MFDSRRDIVQGKTAVDKFDVEDDGERECRAYSEAAAVCEHFGTVKLAKGRKARAHVINACLLSSVLFALYSGRGHP
jgi:hypothetical protein